MALERVGFSPGIIDGKVGPKTELATREFQRVRGLPVSGRLDEATLAALRVDAAGAVTNYVVQAGDSRKVGPTPSGWEAKSRLEWLGYESLLAAVAERFHCSRDLLVRLNPDEDLGRLEVGDRLVVPAVTEPASAVQGASLEINFGEKVIRVLDGEKRLLALFHCSIAADRAKRPSGQTRVAVITPEPTYLFDPAMWPEVKNVDRKLLIPPGPRNPVGLCWIGLSLPGYGIHGTPNPEMIGKTGSHGCFRLSNWDAQRLGRMISVGAPVRFTESGGVRLARQEG